MKLDYQYIAVKIATFKYTLPIFPGMDKQLEKIRHSASHILAAAVKKLYPKAQLGIGPAIEEGFYYDFDNLVITENDLKKIEIEMQSLICKNLKFTKKYHTREEAKKLIKNEKYKLDILKGLKEKPSFYISGDFTDLCKGPHVKSTREIAAFKLLKIAGAYWKGDSKNKMLTRIYGTAFSSKKELTDYLEMLRQAELRNHIKLGKELGLFSIRPEGPGFIFWHNKGMILRNELINFWREKHKGDYEEVSTPPILSKTLWETSGHWENYQDNMYFTKIDDQDFAIKPMNCPGGILIYKHDLHSYRELPLRVAELGLVHRHELSGVLNGLFRVRNFTQDDAHIYCAEDQIEKEIDKVILLVMDMYKTFGFNKYEFEISTKPKKYVGSDRDWSKAINVLKNVLKKRKIKFDIDEGAGVFYGPKIDIKIKDSLGRKWQCATIQYDFNLPKRFDLTYEGKDGKKHRPLMIHRVIYGSLERFIGILIEHYAGHLPLWLSPIQVKIVTVNDHCIKFAEDIANKLKESSIRVEVDDRSESIGKKVRDAQLLKIPIIITVGEKEVKEKTIAVREDGKVNFGVDISNFIDKTAKKIRERC